MNNLFLLDFFYKMDCDDEITKVIKAMEAMKPIDPKTVTKIQSAKETTATCIVTYTKCQVCGSNSHLSNNCYSRTSFRQ